MSTEPTSCLICIERSAQAGPELTIAIHNIGGRGRMLYGQGSDFGIFDLRLIFRTRNNMDEIKKQLEATPPITRVTLAGLSEPIKESELAGVRDLFAVIGYDSSEVSDKQLLLYLDSQLEEENTYYLDFDRRWPGTPAPKIRIKRLDEHPLFSPDWTKRPKLGLKNLPHRDMTMDDLKIVEVSDTIEVRVGEQGEPPRGPKS